MSPRDRETMVRLGLSGRAKQLARRPLPPEAKPGETAICTGCGCRPCVPGHICDTCYTRTQRKPRALPVVASGSGHMALLAGNRAGDGQHPLGECAQYTDCLDAVAKRYGEASCPLECRWWTAAAFPRATEYVSLNGQGRGA